MGLGDEELKNRLLADLDEGFDSLMVAYQRLLYHFVRHMLPHPRDTEDIVQEVFLRAYDALEKWTPQQILDVKLRPWLLRIARNTSLNYLTRGGTRWYYTASLDAPSEQASYESSAGNQYPSPESIIEQQETNEELYLYIRALPYHMRIAVVLHYILDIPYREIATILDQPLNTVKNNALRGCRRLQEMMKARQPLEEEMR
jgi:RNA polymerase sigma-70 factor (ECF subfamily)